MKSMTRLTALLLCLSLLLGMTACGAKPAETEPPTQPPTEAPTEPPVSELYAKAYDSSAASSKFMMEVTSTKTTVVGSTSLTQTSDQTIYYENFGTDEMAYRSTESVSYGDIVSYTYDETYISGMLYVCVDYTDRFSGVITVQDAKNRYLNPLMLDASLYSSITEDASGAILFETPTAAESWAMPEGGELKEASGKAVIGSDGKLQDLSYSISYTFGPAEITLDVNVVVTFGPTTVNVPTEASNYLLIEDIDAVYLTNNAAGLLFSSDSVTTSSLESVMSQAASVVRNQSTSVDMYISESDFISKIDQSIFMKDYTTNTDYDSEQESTYIDGKYRVTYDDGDPEVVPGIKDADIFNLCIQLIGADIIRFDFWRDAEIIDLGSTLLVELVLNDDFGDAMEGSICGSFWNDSKFLRNLATDYVLMEAKGYVSIDKFLGLPTAAGYYYEGKHTIDGTPYILSMQSDQSIDGASMESYYNIREELPAEEEPEEKATPLFYHVTGDDGQEMWLFGTIHVGDERTAYLPQEIYDALEASDALALEYYSNGFDKSLEEDDKLQEEVSNCYYYSDGSTTADHVGEEVYEQAEKYLKASGNYNMNAPYMKASIWSNSIENFYLRQGYRLTSEQGCESRLEKLAEDQEKEIRDVESGLFQVKMLTGWSDDLQKVLLEDTLEYNSQEYWESTEELYELWCAGDEAALRKELSDEVDTSELTEEELAEYEAQKHLLEEYNKAMSYDRNDGMLKVAIDYLESGDTVFYAVGLAHLLNNVNGLVDALRAAGYTVELVEYAQ